jgi:carbamate kinase
MKIVVALGGNALGNTPEEQKKLVKETAVHLVDLIEKGHQLVIAHGNGPQVGMINLAFQNQSLLDNSIPIIPFPECGAMSQGYIGYHLQNALGAELEKRKINKSVSTIITQVLVDKDDPAFDSPSKPVGSFYSQEKAVKLKEEKGYQMIEDAGRGYRRVVPSPQPVDIVEKEIITNLIEDQQLVIACGGGGIPVIKEGRFLEGVSAVIDKDFASEKLAEIVDADLLVILTAVDKVAINFGEEDEKWLDQINIQQAKKYIEEGHFAPGSMLPKVKAAVSFVEKKKSGKALITSLSKAQAGLEGKTGTLISRGDE